MTKIITKELLQIARLNHKENNEFFYYHGQYDHIKFPTKLMKRVLNTFHSTKIKEFIAVSDNEYNQTHISYETEKTKGEITINL